MSNFCLPEIFANKFLGLLKTGEMNPDTLAKMTSEERHKFFMEKVGIEDDIAKSVNALFESKLLLKNQQQGMVTWAKTVGGLKPEVRKDLISKINKLDRVLSDGEEQSFLKDLAEQKLGIGVTAAEGQKLLSLAKTLEEQKQRVLENPTDETGRIDYGNALLDFHEYANSLSPVKANKVVNLLNLPKSIMASLDLSAPFRQGFGMIGTKQFWSAFPKMFKYAASEQNYKDLMADIVSHPNYDIAKSAGLRITTLTDKLTAREEAFQSSLLDKVPGFRGSERAFTGFLNRLRFDRFNALLDSAKVAGEDVSKGSEGARDLANVVNDFTGSGNIGKNDRYKNVVPAANTAFFSPRKISATINMLNPTRYVDPSVSPTARRAALTQLMGSVGISVGLLTLAKMVGQKVEENPTSSDFGKIKVGNTRFDVTGGNGTYAVLLSRILSGKTKSTNTEVVRNLGEGFNSSNRGDVAVQYLRNKLSPTASFVADWLYGKDATGAPFSLSKEAMSRITPMIIADTISMASDPKNSLGKTAITVLANSLGVGTQNFSRDTDWNNSASVVLSQFKDKVGNEKFKVANQEYNSAFNSKIEEVLGNSKYQALSEEEKSKLISKIGTDLRNKTLLRYGFKYKSPPTKKVNIK